MGRNEASLMPPYLDEVHHTYIPLHETRWQWRGGSPSHQNKITLGWPTDRPYWLLDFWSLKGWIYWDKYIFTVWTYIYIYVYRFCMCLDVINIHTYTEDLNKLGHSFWFMTIQLFVVHSTAFNNYWFNTIWASILTF
jgi:hypothetical protein